MGVGALTFDGVVTLEYATGIYICKLVLDCYELFYFLLISFKTAKWMEPLPVFSFSKVSKLLVHHCY